MKFTKLLTLILIIVWMITVFCFSQQNAENSNKTSGKVAGKVVEVLNKDISQNEKVKKVKEYQPTVRKLAHYFLYTIGGILIYAHVNLYNISIDKKILTTQLTGTIYAVTDELHQTVISGRSGELRDVIIDTLGIITGILICLMILKITNKKSEDKLQSERRQ